MGRHGVPGLPLEVLRSREQRQEPHGYPHKLYVRLLRTFLAARRGVRGERGVEVLLFPVRGGPAVRPHLCVDPAPPARTATRTRKRPDPLPPRHSLRAPRAPPSRGGGWKGSRPGPAPAPPPRPLPAPRPAPVRPAPALVPAPHQRPQPPPLPRAPFVPPPARPHPPSSSLRREPRLPADAGVPGGVFLCLRAAPLRGALARTRGAGAARPGAGAEARAPAAGPLSSLLTRAPHLRLPSPLRLCRDRSRRAPPRALPGPRREGSPAAAPLGPASPGRPCGQDWGPRALRGFGRTSRPGTCEERLEPRPRPGGVADGRGAAGSRFLLHLPLSPNSGFLLRENPIHLPLCVLRAVEGAWRPPGCENRAAVSCPRGPRMGEVAPKRPKGAP